MTTALTRRAFSLQFAAGSAALMLPGCASATRMSGAAPATPQDLLDQLAWDLLEASPESATSLGVDTGTHAALRSKLGDRSPAGVGALRQHLREGLDRVDHMRATAADSATAATLDVVHSAYRTALDGFALPYGDVAVGGWRNTPYAVIQNVGAYLDTPRFLDADHPVKSADDAEAYLARLAQFGSQLDGETARIAAARRGGMVPPDFLLDKTLRQLATTIADAREGGGLVTSLVRRADAIPGNWDARARALVTGSVLPALLRQQAEITAQRALARPEAGMWARPHGDAFYAWALRASTTTPRTPDEIHAMGLDQVRELQGRMDPLLRALGFTSGSVGERMIALGNDPRFAFPDSDAGRAEIIALMQSKIAFIRARLPQAFRRLAPGNLEIRRLPPAEEAGAPGAYGGAGSIDGTVPGKIWLNLGDMSRHSRFSLPTLAFHEGIPGHVWQGEFANRLPLIRTLLQFNAYSEGWALYAEQLGDELGTYDEDPVGRLGYLQSLSFRACRMVVDTGLHAKRWTREQAVQWFSQTNGSGVAEVAPEVDRYCSWPGQACGYKMGHSEIVRLRTQAQQALGDTFDLRDFDSAVVEGGNVPLDVLARNVEHYVTNARG